MLNLAVLLIFCEHCCVIVYAFCTLCISAGAEPKAHPHIAMHAPKQQCAPAATPQQCHASQQLVTSSRMLAGSPLSLWHSTSDGDLPAFASPHGASPHDDATESECSTPDSLPTSAPPPRLRVFHIDVFSPPDSPSRGADTPGSSSSSRNKQVAEVEHHSGTQVACAARAAANSGDLPGAAGSHRGGEGVDSCCILAVSNDAGDDNEDSGELPNPDSPNGDMDDVDAAAGGSPPGPSSRINWAPAFAAPPATRTAPAGSGAAGLLPGRAARGTQQPTVVRPILSTPSLKERQLAKLRMWQQAIKQQNRMQQLCTVPAMLCAVPEEAEMRVTCVAPHLPGAPPAAMLARARPQAQVPPPPLPSGGKRTIIGANGQLQTLPAAACC